MKVYYKFVDGLLGTKQRSPLQAVKSPIPLLIFRIMAKAKMKKKEGCLSNPYVIQCINHIVGQIREAIRNTLHVKPFTSNSCESFYYNNASGK